MPKSSSRKIALDDSTILPGLRSALIDPRHRIRRLAREAERLDFEGVALDLFFAVARIEATGRLDAVRADLADTARAFHGAEARLYRRAVRFLAVEGNRRL